MTHVGAIAPEPTKAGRPTGGRAIRAAVAGAVLAVLALWGWQWGAPWTMRLQPAAIMPDRGHAYLVPVSVWWPLILPADGDGVIHGSSLTLREDGRPLGPAHQLHDMVRENGEGRFSHWQHALWFSASDNGDPRANGRDYRLHGTVWLDGRVAAILAGIGLGLMGPLLLPWAAGRIGRFRAAPPVPARRRWTVVLVPAVLAAGGASGLGTATGVMAVAVGGLGAAALLTGLCVLAHLACPSRFARPWDAAANVLLMSATLIAGLMAAEMLLADAAQSAVMAAVPASAPASARLLTPEAAAMLASRPERPQIMPPEWARRAVEVPGASSAYVWHGALHVRDRWRMRRTAPIPPKAAGVTRVLVFGDSLTYGEGVAEHFTYPALLATALGQGGAVEVYSMGVSGDQSEDILNSMRRWVQPLAADVVVYGICQNDFLPAGMGQYSRRDAYPFPLPSAVKKYFLARTKIAVWLDHAYGGALRSLHLRYDFHDDILADFGGNQQRFARDVAAMNQVVTGLGLPPVLAMVLDQFPDPVGRGRKIAEVAEALARKAGMIVVPTDAYYAAGHGKMVVSPWEGHPNERAHALFAEMLLEPLQTIVRVRNAPGGSH